MSSFQQIGFVSGKPVTERVSEEKWQLIIILNSPKEDFQTYLDDKKYVLLRPGHLIKAANKSMSITSLGFKGFLYAKRIWVGFYTDLILKKKII